MNIALIIIYVLCGMALLSAAALHGRKRSDDEYNFFTVFFSWVIRLVLIWWALGWRFI